MGGWAGGRASGSVGGPAVQLNALRCCLNGKLILYTYLLHCTRIIPIKPLLMCSSLLQVHSEKTREMGAALPKVMAGARDVRRSANKALADMCCLVLPAKEVKPTYASLVLTSPPEVRVAGRAAMRGVLPLLCLEHSTHPWHLSSFLPPAR